MEGINDKSMKDINVNNKININLENSTKKLLKSKRTHKFYDGQLQGTEFKDCLEKINKMRWDDSMHYHKAFRD